MRFVTLTWLSHDGRPDKGRRLVCRRRRQARHAPEAQAEHLVRFQQSLLCIVVCKSLGTPAKEFNTQSLVQRVKKKNSPMFEKLLSARLVYT